MTSPLASGVTGLLFIMSVAGRAAALLSTRDATDCDCFATLGAVDSLFTERGFYDFRYQSQYAGVPDLITDEATSQHAPITSDFFKAANWTDYWSIQTWDNGFKNGDSTGDNPTVQMTNSANNLYIEKNTDHSPESDTWLTLRSASLPGFQSVAEFDASDPVYQFLSTRMYARVIGDPGSCASMFAYEGETSPVQEADIEFLTKDPKDFGQYTNQPGATDGATANATLPVPIDQWATHRYDWTPGVSTWYVNDQQVAQIHLQTPRLPLKVIFNNWSNGNDWTGVMKVGHSAYLQIQWIDVAFNTTVAHAAQPGSADRLRRRSEPIQTCSSVCSLDDTKPSVPVAVPVDAPVAVPSTVPNAVHGSVPSTAPTAVFSLPPFSNTSSSKQPHGPLAEPTPLAIPAPLAAPAPPAVPAPPAAPPHVASPAPLVIPPSAAATLFPSSVDQLTASCTAGDLVFNISLHWEQQMKISRRSQTSAATTKGALLWVILGGATAGSVFWHWILA